MAGVKGRKTPQPTCFGITLATTGYFFLELDKSMNILRLFREMDTFLIELQSPHPGQPKYHGQPIYEEFVFSYDLLRLVVYSSLSQCGIMDQLRRTSCLNHHGGVLKSVIMDGILVGPQNQRVNTDTDVTRIMYHDESKTHVEQQAMLPRPDRSILPSKYCNPLCDKFLQLPTLLSDDQKLKDALGAIITATDTL